MIYTVTFNPAVDYIVRTKALTAGAVNRSESEEIYFGGKGINVSLVLSELGVSQRHSVSLQASQVRQLKGYHRKGHRCRFCSS